MAKKVKVETKTDGQNAKLLDKVPPEYVFYCHDGTTFTNVNELAAGLATMADETFSFHSNLEKQDFSNWVRDVIGDNKLADDLARAESRLEATEYVVARIAFLSSK
jgi:hypothetical protein